MKTRISSDNPFGYNRYGYAWEHVPTDGAAHLDYGCYGGNLLNSLRAKGVSRLVGLDASREAIGIGQEKFPKLELIHVDANVPLPFEDKIFNSISIIDVLEHIHIDDQIRLLKEFRRVLLDDGILIITVPRQHVFSFLDMGNLKFRFPTLHKWLYCLGHSKQEYQYRFVSNPDGLVGDVSAKKRWHEHFTPSHMADLLSKADFKVVEFDGSGLFMRIIRGLRKLLGWIGPADRMFRKLGSWDMKRFQSVNLYCVAKIQPQG
ncbi:MAG: class I SAM-dependent methyltransferase [Planctomycetota bacterium]|nr:MAG: class I SAM-dependent methyltransferase [Planctomycetota bacterium]